VLVALVTAASAWGSAPDADAARFARAVDDYQQGRYAASAHLFEALARSAPRAADAWANFGTAAFAAADTASAAIGWQRALRLEPLAADVRDRLDVVAPASGLAPGAVPVVPPAPIAIAAAALWCFGWLVLAWRVHRGRARAGAVFPCAIAGAVALASVAVLVDGRLGVRDLVVVRRESSLRLLPALAAERGAAVHIGEVARVLQRDGPWAHIAEERDRDGWIASEDLLPLSD
jgi:tetratricopeptide (TPR) repeat protein